MLKHKYIDLICITFTLIAIVITILFMNGEVIGIKNTYKSPGYEKRLFDKSKVHNIDIIIDDWNEFLKTAPEEAFARRNFGINHGKLYKPDYRNLNDENADVHLRYTDDNFESYDNIFRNAKFDINDSDRKRVIDALKALSTQKDLESSINIDQVLRYFTVQVFVVNLDSYLGKTGHNYFLHEKDGVLSILPWSKST